MNGVQSAPPRYGARVYQLEKRILVKQTILRGIPLSTSSTSIGSGMSIPRMTPKLPKRFAMPVPATYSWQTSK
jgi:hypothetical protein